MSRTKQAEISNLILDYVKQHGSVTFIELQEYMEEFIDPYGKYAMEYEPNAIIWFHMSKELAEAIQGLLDKEILRLVYSSELEYLKAGVIVTLPVAGKRQPKEGYKKPRWIPLALEINDKKGKK